MTAPITFNGWKGHWHVMIDGRPACAILIIGLRASGNRKDCSLEGRLGRDENG
ncbi:hypothetical protein [Roseicyclus mahoneyensis]|uniref:hypothetical protein n=1 Tax=Roseicyclus mahoneyensis TaxID=164332 RepID=UPI001475F881|nr:hypothetical protein [Roseicyclus mahoneyensis]